MKMKRIIAICVASAALFGAGCSKLNGGAQAITGSVVGGGPGAPKDVAAEFKNAGDMQTLNQTVDFEDGAASIHIRIPEAWKRDHDTWTQDDTRTNYVRIMHVAGEAEADWQHEQKLDIYSVAAVDKTSDGFLLIANHPTLLTTIIRKYIPDSTQTGAYYLIDCRIDYTQHRSESLSACKAGIASFGIDKKTP